MNPLPDQTTTSENVLRVVVDAQIVLSMFLTRRDRPGLTSPKRQLLKLLPVRTFRWLWTPDIISDYERGADAIEADERIMRRAEFDRVAFHLFLAALQLWPPVAVSVTRCVGPAVEFRKRRAQRTAILTTPFTWRALWTAKRTF